ncbi:hypothetical protein MLD38_033975 [Melastoma candidum]|uniref:Uncharacterized protein n=1 Tax=Melastoma candidum TaxID=119954 RepID=A0ACB9M8Z2_9MYRT|nr:hypothetical protein MLD38_033975 [Melastoma candidum]
MISPLTEIVAHGGRMGMYDPQIGFGNLTSSSRVGALADQQDIASRAVPPPIIIPRHIIGDAPSCTESGENSRSDDGGQRPDKTQRRLVQNREAARKSRLRKKAYVQQLESSRLKLAQLEHELDRTRHQGIYRGNAIGIGRFGFSRPINSGIRTFDIEYTHWVEEQRRKNIELRNAVQTHASKVELQMLVDSHLKHYDQLFRMKTDAAKDDVFYIMSGTWRTSAERFFLWIGGFRPSELLNVLTPQIEPMTDQQILNMYNLRQSCKQAEDALSQGMDKLQQNLIQEVTADQIGGGGTYRAQVATAMEKLEAWENFVNQADHLRQQTMRRMSHILTTHQAAHALVGLGDYFDRLRALSSLWAARPCGTLA